jgi:hypothetical protein
LQPVTLFQPTILLQAVNKADQRLFAQFEPRWIGKDMTGERRPGVVEVSRALDAHWPQHLEIDLTLARSPQ